MNYVVGAVKFLIAGGTWISFAISVPLAALVYTLMIGALEVKLNPIWVFVLSEALFFPGVYAIGWIQNKDWPHIKRDTVFDEVWGESFKKQPELLDEIKGRLKKAREEKESETKREGKQRGN